MLKIVNNLVCQALVVMYSLLTHRPHIRHAEYSDEYEVHSSVRLDRYHDDNGVPLTTPIWLARF